MAAAEDGVVNTATDATVAAAAAVARDAAAAHAIDPGTAGGTDPSGRRAGTAKPAETIGTAGTALGACAVPTSGAG
ncbi:MAG: hypothetical protein LKM32_02660 [Chiayiivirga sp.]|nr:hypothetical protein [Chiayiivirga sp.]MCI1728337.1 hypothetical protein [Chiayiivirga sp.]